MNNLVTLASPYKSNDDFVNDFKQKEVLKKSTHLEFSVRNIYAFGTPQDNKNLKMHGQKPSTLRSILTTSYAILSLVSLMSIPFIAASVAGYFINKKKCDDIDKIVEKLNSNEPDKAAVLKKQIDDVKDIFYSTLVLKNPESAKSENMLWACNAYFALSAQLKSELEQGAEIQGDKKQILGEVESGAAKIFNELVDHYHRQLNSEWSVDQKIQDQAQFILSNYQCNKENKKIATMQTVLETSRQFSAVQGPLKDQIANVISTRILQVRPDWGNFHRRAAIILDREDAPLTVDDVKYLFQIETDPKKSEKLNQLRAGSRFITGKQAIEIITEEKVDGKFEQQKELKETLVTLYKKALTIAHNEKLISDKDFERLEIK